MFGGPERRSWVERSCFVPRAQINAHVRYEYQVPGIVHVKQRAPRRFFQVLLAHLSLRYSYILVLTYTVATRRSVVVVSMSRFRHRSTDTTNPVRQYGGCVDWRLISVISDADFPK